MLIDIDDLKYLDKNLNLFSFNKFNIFSFYEKDHGLKNGTPVKDWILEVISKSDIDIDAVSYTHLEPTRPERIWCCVVLL